MTKSEMIRTALEELGYKPQVDDDGDLMIRYQMKSIFAIVGDEDEKYIILMLPQFAEMKEGEETLTFVVCNKMTRELKLAKVYIDQTFRNVSAACEFYYTDEEALKENIEKSLNILGIVRSVFHNTKLEMEK